MRILLLGFMGSGKSTVGQLLAKQLGYRFAEMDDLIGQLAQLSIPQIFKQFGEPQFRTFEEQVAKSLKSEGEIVISAGGGVVEYPKTMEYLQQEGTSTILLECSLEVVLRRLDSEHARRQRPLAQSGERLAELFCRREQLYLDYCDLRIETDQKTPSQVVTEIVAQYPPSKPW